MTSTFQEQLTALLDLQQLDVSLHTLQLELSTLPEELREMEALYLQAKSGLTAAQAELAEVEKVKRSDESDLAASVAHLKQSEARLNAIKTTKEYQASLKEISDGKKLNREREDRVLQSMEKIEALTQKTTQLRASAADKETAWRGKRDAVSEKEAGIRAKMEADSARRPALVAGIEPSIIRKYEYVRKHYAVAMAGIRNGVCQGCSRKILPQLVNEMLRKTELKSCPNCQRLIYVIDEPAEGETTSVAEIKSRQSV